MAPTTDQKKAETPHDNPFGNPFMSEQMWQDLGLAAWTDRVQGMGEAQARSVRHIAEQLMSYGRQLNDQVGTQTEVTTKLVKDSFDYSVQLMNTWRKIVLDTTQSTLDHIAPKK